jgi:hypothetical protein
VVNFLMFIEVYEVEVFAAVDLVPPEHSPLGNFRHRVVNIQIGVGREQPEADRERVVFPAPLVIDVGQERDEHQPATPRQRAKLRIRPHFRLNRANSHRLSFFQLVCSPQDSRR